MSGFHLTIFVRHSAQVAFGPGATTSSSTIRSFGVPKNGGSKSSSSCLELKSSDDGEILSLLPFKKDETDVSFEDATDASTLLGKNEYREPWVRNPFADLSLSHSLSLCIYLYIYGRLSMCFVFCCCRITTTITTQLFFP